MDRRKFLRGSAGVVAASMLPIVPESKPIIEIDRYWPAPIPGLAQTTYTTTTGSSTFLLDTPELVETWRRKHTDMNYRLGDTVLIPWTQRIRVGASHAA